MKMLLSQLDSLVVLACIPSVCTVEEWDCKTIGFYVLTGE